MLKVRYLSDAVNAAAASYAKNTIKARYSVVREEVEQDVIHNSVEVNIKKRVTISSFPLMQNSVIKLASNKNKALQIYNQGIQKLDQNLQDKRDVIESEAKVQKLGFVEFVKNVTLKQQQMLKAGGVQNFIPWRAVWNGNSVSTLYYIVFDASQETPSGTSLNDIGRSPNGYQVKNFKFFQISAMVLINLDEKILKI